MRGMNHRIAHAKSYPFPIPPHGYLFEDGGWRPLDGHVVDRVGRVPVLAAGSNQSPEQLRRKYQNTPGIAIACQRARLHHFDVVYAAHLSAYGSVPATFQASPGTAVTVFVQWLDERALQRMHETEGNYTFDALEDVRVELDGDGGTLTSAFAYSSRVGCFNLRGSCLALAAIPATGRTLPAASQIEALTAVRDRFAPGVPLDDFMAAYFADDAVRRRHSTALGADALAQTFARRTVRSC
jgi:hypothetical protein